MAAVAVVVVLLMVVLPVVVVTAKSTEVAEVRLALGAVRRWLSNGPGWLAHGSFMASGRREGMSCHDLLA